MNCTDIAERIEEAAQTMRRLPRERGPYRNGCFWPEVVHDFWESYGNEPDKMRPSVPSASAISRMQEVCTWLQWLEPAQASLVWARASGVYWRKLEIAFTLNRSRLHREYKFAIYIIHASIETGKPRVVSFEQRRKIVDGTLPRAPGNFVMPKHGISYLKECLAVSG